MHFRKFVPCLLILFSALSAYGQDDVRPQYFIGYSNLQAEGLPDKNDPDNLLSPDFLDRRTTLHGINAAVTFPFANFGLTGDFSFNRNDESADFADVNQSIKTDVFYFVGGPSLQFPNASRFEPLVRLLVGAARTNFEVESRRETTGGTLSNEFDAGSTDLALMIGAGFDVRVSDRIKVRVLQIDYAPIFLGDRAISVLGSAGAVQTLELEGQRQDHVRISFGVTF